MHKLTARSTHVHTYADLVPHRQHHSRRGVHSLTERQRVVVVVVTKHTRDLDLQ
jgi:hypothetical protein